MQRKRQRAKPAGTPERADLAVYAHRVLAALRPLDAIECDAVLHAALELNRPSQIHLSPVASPGELPKSLEES